MSYTIVNRSDTFLTLDIGGKQVSLPFGKRLVGVHKNHITNDIRWKARKGIIALVFESDRELEAKVGRIRTLKPNQKKTSNKGEPK